MLSHSFLYRTISQFLILTENLKRVLKNQHNLFNLVSFDRVLFMIQYFLGRTLQTQAISDRTMQGSVLSCRIFLVPHYWRENIVWFSIIGKNLFDSAFLDTEPFTVQHYRAEPYKVQYGQTEPFPFIIFGERASYGSVLLGRTSLVQDFQTPNLFPVQHYRTNLSWFSIIGQNLSGFSTIIQNYKVVLKNSIFFQSSSPTHDDVTLFFFSLFFPSHSYLYLYWFLFSFILHSQPQYIGTIKININKKMLHNTIK